MSSCKLKPPERPPRSSEQIPRDIKSLYNSHCFDPISDGDNCKCKLPMIANSNPSNSNEGCQKILPLPRIPRQSLKNMFKCVKEGKRLSEEVTQNETLVNDLTVHLTAVKDAIEKTFGAQKQTQIEIEKCSKREEMEMLLDLKCRQQHELMECLKLEEKYLHDLNCAQRAMRENRIKKQSHYLHIMDSKIDQVYSMYETQMDQMYRRRLYRECAQRTTMQRYKHQAMKNFLSASIDQKMEIHEAAGQKPQYLASKDAMKKINPFIRTTTCRRRKLKGELQLTQKLRQYHQKQALLALKVKMDKQKEDLSRQQELRQKRKEREAQQNELKRLELAENGANPFVVDEWVRLQNKLKQNELKAMESKSAAILRIQDEIHRREREYCKATESRRRWDRFWAKKAREKRQKNLAKYNQDFLAEAGADSGDDRTEKIGNGRHEKWLQIAKDTYGYEEGYKLKTCSNKEPQPPFQQQTISFLGLDYNDIDEDEQTQGKYNEFEEEVDGEGGYSRKQSRVSENQPIKSRTNTFSSLRSKKSKKSTLGKSSHSTIGSVGTGKMSKNSNKRSKSTLSQTSKLSNLPKAGKKFPFLPNDDGEEGLFEAQEEYQSSLTGNSIISRESTGKPVLTVDEMNEVLNFRTATRDGFYYPLGCEMPDSKGSYSIPKVLNRDTNLSPNKNLDTPIWSWSPKVISFTNFDVGKTYKVKVVVMQRSSGRLKYYFKEILEPAVFSNAPTNPPPTATSLPGNMVPESPAKDSYSSARTTTAVEASLEKQNEDQKSTGGALSVRLPKTSAKSAILKKTKIPAKRSTRSLARVSKEASSDPKAIAGFQNSKQESHTNINENNNDRGDKEQDKILDLVHAGYFGLSDLIKVNFTVPQALSAGVAHAFYITFKPKVQGDWSGQLSFTSERENFNIPVEIHKRRFKPVLVQNPQSTVSFLNTVVGTGFLKKVKLKNVGDLGGRIINIFESKPPKNYMSDVDYEEHRSRSVVIGEKDAPSGLSDKTHSLHESKQDLRKSLSEVAATLPAAKSVAVVKKAKSIKKVKSGKSKLKVKSTKSLIAGSITTVDTKSHHKSVTVLDTLDKEKNLKNVKNRALVGDILSSLIQYVTDSIFVFYVEEMTREMKPGDELNLSIVFRPPFVSNFTTQFEISFAHHEDADAIKHEIIDDIVLDVAGVAVENPCYIQPVNGDFKICMMNHSYQQSVTAHVACCKWTGKVKARVPAVLKDFVDVHPQEASVLFASHPCQFCIKFKPKRSILINPEKYREFFDPETNIIDFPVYFDLKFPRKVPSPIKATFLAVLSDTRLLVEPLEIDMGECLPNETVKNVISIRNLSQVRQKLGFVNLPEEITIQPNDGFGTILPGEDITFEVLLSIEPSSPSSVKAHKGPGPRLFQLKLVTFAKEEYDLRVKCVVKASSIRVTPTKISFPATPCGTTASSSISILVPPHFRRGLTFRQKFQVDNDPSVPVKILPESGFLEFGTEMKLSVIFEASISDETVLTGHVELMKKRYLERINAYQRELEAINLHIENDWMLDDKSNPDVLHFRTSLESLKNVSNPALAEALKRIAVRQILKNTEEFQSSDEEHGKPLAVTVVDPIISNPSRQPSTAKRASKFSLGSKKKQQRALSVEKDKSKGTKTVKLGPKSADKKERGDGSFQSDDEDKSGKDGDSGKGKNSRKSSGDLHSIPSVHDIPDVPVKQQMLKELEKRRQYVQDKIQEPFVPPDVTNLTQNSTEFVRTKRELMKNLTCTCQVNQFPIYIFDRSSVDPTDVFNVTVKCPVMRPDLILLDESSTFEFGTVPVNRMAWKEMSVYNVSGGVLNLHVGPLNPWGPFLQSNAVRALAPEHVYTLKVRFEPQFEDEFEEQFTIKGGESRVVITLRGKGGASTPSTPKRSDTNIKTSTVQGESEEESPSPPRTAPPSDKSSSNLGKKKLGKKRPKRQSVQP